jgi:hypothetical protein
MIGTGTAANSRAQHEVLEIGIAGAYTCIMDVTAKVPTTFAAQVAQLAAAVSAQVQPPVIPVVLPPPAVCMADCPALTACWRDYLRLLTSEDRSWTGKCICALFLHYNATKCFHMYKKLSDCQRINVTMCSNCYRCWCRQ